MVRRAMKFETRIFNVVLHQVFSHNSFPFSISVLYFLFFLFFFHLFPFSCCFNLKHWLSKTWCNHLLICSVGGGFRKICFNVFWFLFLYYVSFFVFVFVLCFCLAAFCSLYFSISVCCIMFCLFLCICILFLFCCCFMFCYICFVLSFTVFT